MLFSRLFPASFHHPTPDTCHPSLQPQPLHSFRSVRCAAHSLLLCGRLWFLLLKFTYTKSVVKYSGSLHKEKRKKGPNSRRKLRFDQVVTNQYVWNKVSERDVLHLVPFRFTYLRRRSYFQFVSNKWWTSVWRVLGFLLHFFNISVPSAITLTIVALYACAKHFCPSQILFS